MTDDELIEYYTDKEDRARNSSIGSIEIKCSDLVRLLELAREGNENLAPPYYSALHGGYVKKGQEPF